MTEDEAYKVHIQYTFNAFCKVVIRHAAIDIILKLRRRWEWEVVTVPSMIVLFHLRPQLRSL